MWVKICGITTLEDAQLAVSAGADAVGFVFAESPRRVTVEAVRKITARLPAAVEKIGVFVNAPFESMVNAIEMSGLTGIQLHGEDRPEMIEALRERNQKKIRHFRIVQVLHFGRNHERFASQLRSLTEKSTVDTILVDTSLPGQQGGTGVPFDWQAAQESFIEGTLHARLIAAGGLNPENVEQAIQMLQPWGVDVSSGVEAVPGRKDARRVDAFLRAARAAAVFPGNAGAAMQR